jgi:hypothetical protein
MLPTLLLLSSTLTLQPTTDRIQPWSEDPRYWQYQGEPVLLLGGSKDDSLFQIPDLEEHLDLLASVGGNYIRNTMSSRQDHGFEVYPYERLEDGRYDLDQWNEEYWARFERLLELTSERGIIVQIEVWDRFDHAQEHWAGDPYNPRNNINYTSEETGLQHEYPQPAWRDRQPFFHTIPGMPLYDEGLDVVREYQERFVAKLLSHSLPYPNVLYCMNNETSTPVEWGQHWMALIHEAGADAGLPVYATDMFDDVWEPKQSGKLRLALDSPEVYPFIDISQVNSRSFGQEQWDLLMWIHNQVSEHPRPLNNVKIYSDGETNWGSGTPQDGIERFFRQLLAGAAAARFHRDGAGIGLSDLAQACIRSARLVETVAPFWELEPRMDLLGEREPNEAYLAADPGRTYVVFFPTSGQVELDLRDLGGEATLRWIRVRRGLWGGDESVTGGGRVTITTPDEGAWVGVVAG